MKIIVREKDVISEDFKTYVMKYIELRDKEIQWWNRPDNPQSDSDT